MTGSTTVGHITTNGHEPSTNGVAKDNWIKLNVGGTIFQTTVSTLAKDADSFLYRLVKQPTDGGLASQRDESGAILIDRDPEYFSPVLNFLRHGKLIIGQQLNEEGVLEEAEFYNVTALIKLVKDRIKVKETKSEHVLNRRHIYRVLQCHENELTNLVSTMSDGWKFEQLVSINSVGVLSGSRCSTACQHSSGNADDPAQFLCVVSRQIED